MTLDNGIQSVTIDPIPIKSTNPGVNQEFELVVGNDLQFILTFHAQMDALPNATVTAPQPVPKEPEETNPDSPDSPDRSQASVPPQAASPGPKKEAAPTNTPPISPKKHRFRNMFSSSPKKKPTSPAKPTTMGTQVRTPNPATPRPRENNSAGPKPREEVGESKQRDMWDGLIGPQGEFGRCYLVASQYEQEVYGRPRTFNLSLFDEWGYAEEIDEPEALLMQSQQPPTLASLVPNSNGSAGTHYSNKKAQRYNQTKSRVLNKTGGARKIKRVKLEPFKIASVQITLMYIPRVTMTDPLPTSIKNAMRELQLVQSYKNLYLEGYLSQEGGDCSYWRRRWFELRGDTLIGHTEDSHKVRNVLHLKNVQRIMDVAMMTESEKSEMYGVVSYQDRSFQIAFHDGEVINFYADNAARKNEWVGALQIAITYSTGMRYTWVDRVTGRVAEEKAKAAEALAVRMKHPAALQAALMEGASKLTPGSPEKKAKKVKKASFNENVIVHSWMRTSTVPCWFICLCFFCFNFFFIIICYVVYLYEVC